VANRGLDHRVNRLENDVMSIYEMLTDIKAGQKRHDLSFSALSGQFEELDERLTEQIGTLDGKVSSLDGKVGALDARFTEQIGALDGKVDALDHRLTGQIDALDERLTGQIGALDAKVDEILSILKGPGGAR
jgi:chromosome segregation ATPase